MIRQRLDEGGDVNAVDPKFGVPPLSWAAMRGDADAVQILIDRGGDVNGRNRDGSTPLHGAAFLGRTGAAELLIRHGAELESRNNVRQTPLEVTTVDWGLTRYVASLINVPIGEQVDVEQGRTDVARLLRERIASAGGTIVAADETPARTSGGILAAYQAAISSERLNVRLGSASIHLVETPVFAHLWFLWFLCWMVAGFAVVAWISDSFGWGMFPRPAVLSSWRFLWLVPLTLLPQFFMGLNGPSFGPDDSTGIIPLPHLLLYYGIFFGFGALYFDADDDKGRLGRYWWLLLPAGLLLALPAGLATLPVRSITSITQVVYAWTMCFGVMGLFRKTIHRENRAVRYMSDSSYWLYLTHLPLLIAAQVVVRDWPWPPVLKFLLITTVVTGGLLIAYQTMVRYTWVGRMLNGPRTRPTHVKSMSEASPLG